MHNTCQIKIGGKKRIFKFNFNSDAIICEGMDITLDQFPQVLVSGLQGRFFIWVFYAGLHNYYEAEGDKESLEQISYHKIADWLVEVSQEDRTKVFETFMKTHQLKNKSNNGQSREGGDKKKSTSNTSKTSESEPSV